MRSWQRSGQAGGGACGIVGVAQLKSLDAGRSRVVYV